MPLYGTRLWGTTLWGSGGVLAVVTSFLPAAPLGQIYNQVLVATGGQPAYTWSLFSGQLPLGVTLGTQGVLSGTPTNVASYTFTIKVTDALGATSLQPYTVVVSSDELPPPPQGGLRFTVFSQPGGLWK